MEAKSMHNEGTDGKQKKRQVIIEKCDRISTLPDAILHHIFSFLPTKIVVRTSILSKRWQKLSISLPYIDLEEFRETHKEGFMNFVDNLLLHHDKSNKIIRFRLSGKNTYDDSHSDAWISSAVRAGVEELDICDAFSSRTFDERTLTSCLFACNSLVSLKLDLGYNIRFPKYFCFPKMKTMHLSRIIFPENFIHLLDYNSPNLEKLFLKFCLIENNSPLSSHTFQDLIADDHILGKFSHLNDVYIGLSSFGTGGHFLGKFIRRLQNVQSLNLPSTSIYLLTSKSYLLHHLPTFYNLKSLELGLGTRVEQLGVMACLLRCSPFLRSLRIEFYNLMWFLESELKPEEFPSLCASATGSTLKWIRMDHYRATKNQFELVRLFLASSPYLEKLIVQVDKYAEKSPFTSDMSHIFRVDDKVIDPISSCKEILQLPRLSTNCVLQVF